MLANALINGLVQVKIFAVRQLGNITAAQIRNSAHDKPAFIAVKHKDLVGGIWVSPVKDLRIGAFGWDGRYTNENYTGAPGTLKQVKRVRWSAGVDYESDWVARAEYLSSVGGVVTDVTKPDRSDAWYATVGVPVKEGLKIYGKWDCYRDNKAWNSLRQMFTVSANWWLGKNLLLQGGYNFIVDRSATDRYQNTIDIQVAARF